MAQRYGQIDRIEHLRREPIRVNGNEDHAVKVLERFRHRGPAFRHEMMRLIHYDPMRPPCAHSPQVRRKYGTTGSPTSQPLTPWPISAMTPHGS